MNIVLNDNTPSPAPSSGCCAGVSDNGSYTKKASMAVNGSAGSGSSYINVLNRLVKYTYLYYVGRPGDYDGISFSAGTWTVPLNVSSLSGTIVVESVYICQANSSGTSKGTIGSTAPASIITGGVNSYSITGSAVGPFSAGDVVVVSFQMQGQPTGSFNAVHDQTITTPSTTGGGASSYYPASGFMRSRGGVPALSNVSTGSVTYSPLAGIVRARSALQSEASAQTFGPLAGIVRARQTPPALAGSGTVTYVPQAALLRLRSAPSNASPLTAHIRFLRGPQAKMPPGWPEGAPFEGGIITPSGSVFTMLFLGGHDGQDKIVGGGFQTCSGQPAWTPASDGSWVPAIVDSTNLRVWIYVNSAWHYIPLT